MNQKNLMKFIKLLELKFKKNYSNLISGFHKSLLTGTGTEFSDFKEYSFIDDFKKIDWNTTAKKNKIYVKNYLEEKELELMIAIDLSQSQKFGTQKKLKIEISIEIASLFLFLALYKNDKIGMCLFSDKIEYYKYSKKGKIHIYELLKYLINFKTKGKKTNLSKVFNFLFKKIKKNTIIIIISDFIDSNKFSYNLIRLGKKNRVIAFNIKDPFEKYLSKISCLRFKDNENNEEEIINLKNENIYKNYSFLYEKKEYSLKKLFIKSKIQSLYIQTNIPYINQLNSFLKKKKF